MIPAEIDVAKKLERARGQVTAGWIENRIVNQRKARLRATGSSRFCRTQPSHHPCIGN